MKRIGEALITGVVGLGAIGIVVFTALWIALIAAAIISLLF